jgi:hypothetical protein
LLPAATAAAAARTFLLLQAQKTSPVLWYECMYDAIITIIIVVVFSAIHPLLLMCIDIQENSSQILLQLLYLNCESQSGQEQSFFFGAAG